ncbi:hypothetical protein [Sphingomonas sp. MMS24-J13]|uniref:hypothetical protein n=1 Tax=Sphingomonas sp. MMS24-J13 TaxID=3238686 RepID=UPI00384A6012
MTAPAAAAVAASSQHSFVTGLGAFFHSTLPHSSAALDALSIGTVIVAGLAAVTHQWMTGKKWPPDQFIRVGFAAGPLPVYLFLPCMPFDNDLAAMFQEERFLIALAAASGFMWTIREIRALFNEERSAAPPEE